MFGDLGSLASSALTIVVAIVALRLVYLTIVGFVNRGLYLESVKSATGTDDVSGLAELMQAELAALREEGGGPGFNLLTSPDAAIDVGSIEAGGGRLKELGALLKLLPGRTQTVSSQMQPAGAFGQGITITIGSTTNRIAATTTLWERGFIAAGDLPPDVVVEGKEETRAPTEARVCLALAAAAWVAYQALRSSSAADRAGLLTQDWESYALFRVGARMQQRELRTAARRLYVDALARDPRNRGALFNLATLDFGEANERSAIERLQAVLDEIDHIPGSDPAARRLDRLWYRATYNVAAARWNLASRTGHLDSATRSAVRDDLRILVEAADAAIADIGVDAISTGNRYADLVRFLIDIRSAAIVIYGDASGSAA